MERSLLWSAFAIGLVGWFCGFLMIRTGRTERREVASAVPRPYLITAILLPILVFLATWPSHGPFFAAGHGFGDGFLLGGLGALLAGAVLLQARTHGPAKSGALSAAALVATPLSLALTVTAWPLLKMRDTLEDALLGVAIGWFVVSFVFALGLSHTRSREAAEPTSNDAVPVILPLVLGIGFTVLLCAVALLGEYHGLVDLTAGRSLPWSVLGLTFAVGVPFVLFLSALPATAFARIALRLPFAGLFARLSGNLFQTEDTRQSAVRGWRLILGAVLLLVLGRLLSGQIAVEAASPDTEVKHTLLSTLVRAVLKPAAWLLGPSDVFHVLCLGLFGGLLAWWIIASRQRLEAESAEATPIAGWQNGALAVLIVVAGLMAAFQMLEGFGVGLLLLGAALPISMAVAIALEPRAIPDAAPPGPAETVNARALATAGDMVRLLLFGMVLVLYRVYYTRFEDDLKGVSLTDHYAIFGFLMGALLPALLSGFLLRPQIAAPVTPGSRIGRLVLAGALTLLIPTIIIALWGPKCGLALFMGLALSIALFGIESRKPATSEGETAASTPVAWLPAFFALALSLAPTQWLGHILPLSDLTRAQKINYLTLGIALLIVLLVVAEISARYSEWQRRQRQGRAMAAASKGAAQ